MNNELLKRILSSIVLLPIILIIVIKGSIYFNIFLILCFLLTIYEWYKITQKNRFSYLGIIYLIFSFFAIYKIRNSFSGEYFYFLFIAGICIATDIGGFVFGKLLKGPKLISISPNKTYSGMMGSFFLTLLFVYLFSNNLIVDYTYNLTLQIFFFSITVSAVSQFGDIIISYFKRVSNVKDTGKIIPGHGGILDRIDGMIFAFPFSYFIIFTNIIEIF